MMGTLASPASCEAVLLSCVAATDLFSDMAFVLVRELDLGVDSSFCLGPSIEEVMNLEWWPASGRASFLSLRRILCSDITAHSSLSMCVDSCSSQSWLLFM